MNPQIIFLLNKSLEYLRNSNLDSAELYLKQALRLQTGNPHVLRLLGVIAAQRKQYSEALKYLNDSLKALPKNSVTLSNLGAVFHDLQEYENALDAYDKSIKIDFKYDEAWSNKGATLNELKRYEEAIAHYDQALSLNPKNVEAWSNKGATLNELKRYEEAIAHYDQALSLNPKNVEAWSNKGATLNELKRYEEAIAHYDQALSLNPKNVEAWSNKGATLNELKRYEEAIAHYDQALSLNPKNVEAWSNKGATLNELKRYEEAIAHYDQALSLNPEYAKGWSNKGVTLHQLKLYDDVIRHYSKALTLEPHLNWVYGGLVHTGMKICSWPGLLDALGNSSKKVMENEKILEPFHMLALNDNAFLQKKCSEIYSQEKYPANSTLGPISKYLNNKIRIGYFSADFHNHATGYLMAELFELHDKDLFELIAFSFGPIASDEMRERLEKSFDQFIEVGNKSDTQIAQLSRALNIDIAIDLKGYTQDSRTAIFAYRAAPIQVNYLGYPGTMGADYIDYIIADSTLIPIQAQSCYSEKVIYLPGSYQVNDRRRLISDKQFTRQELDLPEGGFVFCCFNNSFKILPKIFDGWMRILSGVEGSVLWLFKDNSWAVDNLKLEAEKRGIDSRRLIFAKHMELSEHLARHRQADLFLDTLPCNAHTTASDALWAGLPVLTLMGESFPSRVAASLLNAIDLPELITNTQEEYEALAIELAMNSQKLTDIKMRLAKNRLTSPLFNTPLFTKNLESAYIKMYELYQDGSGPDHITII